MKRVVAAASLVAATLVATAPPAAVRTGLHGRVCQGTPVPQRACAPQRLVFRLVSRARSVTVRTTAVGTYRVALPAGIYRATVALRSTTAAPRLRPALVHVRAGHDDRLDFFFETRPSL